MLSYIVAIVIFISFLLGFFLMFGIMAHFYKVHDDRIETQFCAIRPGYYESTRKKIEHEYEQDKQVKKEQEENEYIPKEYPNDLIMEDEDVDKSDDCDVEAVKKDNFLAGRIHSPKSSFIQCMNSMKSDKTYEDKLKDDKKNENQAYNILKRRMDSKKMKEADKKKQENDSEHTNRKED